MFKLKKPCKNCPFRTDIPFYLRKARAAEIAEALRRGESFHCHKTIGYGDDEDGEETYNLEGAQMCAGAMIVLVNETGTIYSNQMARIEARLVDRDIQEDLEMESPVFDSLTAFVDAME